MQEQTIQKPLRRRVVGACGSLLGALVLRSGCLYYTLYNIPGSPLGPGPFLGFCLLLILLRIKRSTWTGGARTKDPAQKRDAFILLLT